MSNPVVIIHGTKWCGACKQMLSGKRFDELVSLIKSLNPNAEIKIIYHENFDILNKSEEYPNPGKITAFPMIWITSKDNCHRSGDMNKVKINGYKWDGKKLVRQSEKSLAKLDSFLKHNL